MKSFTDTNEKTLTEWSIVNTTGCHQQHPIGYFEVIKESSGQREIYGPLSENNWKIKQKKRPGDVCVYAVYGSTKGPCSVSILSSETDGITEGKLIV